MNRKATLGSNVLAVAAMTVFPAVVKADEIWYPGTVGRRPSYVQHSPLPRTTTRIIEYRDPPIYQSCASPRTRTSVSYVTPGEPTWVYPTRTAVTRVVRTTRPVYVDRRVVYSPTYPVYRHRPVIVRAHRPFRPAHRSVWYPRRHGSRGWGFNIGFRDGGRGHRGGGFGFHFDRYR